MSVNYMGVDHNLVGNTLNLNMTDTNDAYLAHDAIYNFFAWTGNQNVANFLSNGTINATLGAGDDIFWMGADVAQDLAVANIHYNVSAGDGADHVALDYCINGVTIDGGGGDDLLRGGFGNDTIIGGDGNDYIVGNTGNNWLHGGTGNDTIYLDGKEAWPLNTQPLIGSGVGEGTAYGGDGDDFIVGNVGNDWINGGAGNDTIYAGAGWDTIELFDGGADVVHFGAGSARDYVAGFSDNDTLAINSNLATSWTDLLAKSSIYQDGTSTVIEFSNGSELLILTQFQVSNLSANDFLFI